MYRVYFHYIIQLPELSIAITKTTIDKLNECHDLSLNINWPQNTNIDITSYILCIITSINASATIDSATNNMNMLNLFDIDLSDRYQLTPIKLSIDDIIKDSDDDDDDERRRRLQESSDCNSISFNTYVNNAFTANLSVNQNYKIPQCISIDNIYSTTETQEFNFNENNCEIITYDGDIVECGCTTINGNLFILKTEEFEIDMEFNVITDIRNLTGTNLASHPTALIVIIFLIFIYGLGFYWIEDRNELEHIPLLARQDIVFRTSRDNIRDKSALAAIFNIIYLPISTIQKLFETFKIVIFDYHLLISIQWSNKYTNISSIIRLTLLMIYILTMFMLCAYFYGTNNQSHWAVAWCLNDYNYQQYNANQYCSDIAMIFIYSLFSCEKQ